MKRAYILINCELGYEEEIIKNLKEIRHVKEVDGTFGAYDIIAIVEAETSELVRETVSWKIRMMNRITSTLTLMVTQSPNPY